MRAIQVMFDSLRRDFLPPFGAEGCDLPNFERLARRTCCFDNFYAGSLPCMPARRELHTGRYNFLHRGWGPLEPYDVSMPELLSRSGVHTHLVSDHFRYWLDGGANYHPRYTTWENVRGQEGDPWRGVMEDAGGIHTLSEYHARGTASLFRQDRINREGILGVEDMPQTRVFDGGLRFIEENHTQQNWFLQIECFDPHEPFFSRGEWAQRHTQGEVQPIDWPQSAPVAEGAAMVEGIRGRYKALLEYCDHSLGRVLDAMDAYNLWEDTLLIVNTDHGYLLGEHGWWGKNIMPYYNEIAHLPFYLHDPRQKNATNVCRALAQTIDICPTLLDFFGVDIPKEVQGHALPDLLSGKKEREYALFGIHGGHINITDGRYVYMRAPMAAQNTPLYEYTLMPARSFSRLNPQTLAQATLSPEFSFTRGCPLLRYDGNVDLHPGINMHREGSLLFDLESDPKQEHPITNAKEERRLLVAMAACMRHNDAPEEQYVRVGLPAD